MEIKLEKPSHRGRPPPPKDSILLQALLTYLENADPSFKGIKFADLFSSLNVTGFRSLNPLILESGGTPIFHLETEFDEEDLTSEEDLLSLVELDINRENNPQLANPSYSQNLKILVLRIILLLWKIVVHT